MASIPPVGTSAYKAYARANGLPTTPLISTSIPSVPPTGTSAYKAYEYQKRTGGDPTVDGIVNLVSAIKGGISNLTGSFTSNNSGSSGGSSGSYSGGYSDGSSSSDPVPEIDYLYADLAKHYGLSATTAYQEALSNTAYQRSIKDMQAAGLNPAVIYGAGRGSTASGVGYVSEPESPSGGGSGGGYYSAGSSSKGYLFDQGTWGAIGTAAGLVGMAVTKSPTGFWIGQTTAQGIMGAMNSLFGR